MIMTATKPISQAANAAAERYFAMRKNSPDHADRSLAEIISALTPPHCRWTEEEWDGGINTACSQNYCFEEEFKISASYRFCPSCGGEIQL